MRPKKDSTRKLQLIRYFFLLFSLFLLTACPNKDDEPKDPYALDINKFIYSGMYNYYLWVENVNDLSDTRFTSESEWESYLKKYTDHEELFNKLLYSNLDHWSWIVDDYEELENQFQGISKSMGFNFSFGYYMNHTNLFGYVQYVLEGSPAEIAGLKRGDIFLKVNDQQLTVDNYYDLMFASESFTLSMADLNGNSLSLNNKTISLTAVVIHENPIFHYSVINTTNGKAGYLVYNGFMSDYDTELNNVFKYFKEQGILHLILDLRYNPGGSVETAGYMASMIYGTHTEKVLLKTAFNTKFGDYIRESEGEDYFTTYFPDSILATETINAVAIESVNLTELYVLTSRGTASASELIINGLRPYVNVIEIGDTTVGKYVGSMTIKDWDENGDVNVNHKWAMQPIVLKISNSLGQSDFKDGLFPNIVLQEDLANMSSLGNENEPLLNAALNQINGLSPMAGIKSTGYSFTNFADSRDLIPYGKEMYVKNKWGKMPSTIRY